MEKFNIGNSSLLLPAHRQSYIPSNQLGLFIYRSVQSVGTAIHNLGRLPLESFFFSKMCTQYDLKSFRVIESAISLNILSSMQLPPLQGLVNELSIEGPKDTSFLKYHPIKNHTAYLAIG